METTALRQLLKNYCTNSQWSYAVFWNLHQIENYKLLTCEEVYCDDGTNICDDVQSLGVGYPIGNAVVDMSCCQYLLGEGMVGRAAVVESDFWIYSNDNESIQLISKQNSDDWILPIAVGIKTTLLAPLLPYGVLQLGSFEEVAESLAVGADIRDRFFTLFSTTVIPLRSYNDDPLLYSSMLIPEPEANDESFFSFNNAQGMEYEDAIIIHDVIFMENDLPTAYDQLVPLMDELENVSFFVDDQNVFYPYLDTNVDANTTNDLGIADIPEATAMWMFSCHEEEFDDARVIGDSSTEVCSDSVPRQVKYPPAADSAESQTINRDLDNFPRDYMLQEEATEMWMFSSHEEEFDIGRVSGDSPGEVCSDSAAGFEADHTSMRNLNGFPRDCELQEVLRPVFKINGDRHSGYSDEGFGSLAKESSGPFSEGGEQEQLLEDVITTSYKNSYEDTLFYCCNTSKSSVTSLPETAPYDTMSTQGECNTMSDYQSAFGMTSAPSLESLESAIIVDEQQQQAASELLEKNAKNLKRSRGKENPKSNDRPRPRDRQLIQDRLKVLRKLVPDGAKCSIDGLLEQTTKHMMFLKSVTERAEKVKDFTSEEVATNNGNKNNTSLGVQGGNDSEACPIIVKDLEHPSQFQIQMICTDEGVFFEMAEVMHKLKLTILKGSMENRRNKWASFIVEASKGFNRLEIFWPLMRILHKNGNWLTDQLCP